MLLVLALGLGLLRVKAFLVPATRLTALANSFAAKTCLNKQEPTTVRVRRMLVVGRQAFLCKAYAVADDSSPAPPSLQPP